MIRVVSILLALMLISACIHAPVDQVGPSFETVKLIRATSFPPVGLGQFTVAPSQSNFAKRINIRGSTMGPPKGSDFPTFLKQTLMDQLVASGRYDPTSTIQISAEMTKNKAGENLSKGAAQIAATFIIKRGEQVLFSRNYEAENRWKSDFIGAIAIPEAFEQYNELYGQIVRRTLSDPEFTSALAR
jgi:hypothetical protein